MLGRAVVQRGKIVSLGIGDGGADLDYVELIEADASKEDLLPAVVGIEEPLRSTFLERNRRRPVLGSDVKEGSSIAGGGKLM